MAKTIAIPQLQIMRLELLLVGDTSLLCNNPSSYPGPGPQPKNTKPTPEEFFERSLYRQDDAYVFPANAFKLACVAACPPNIRLKQTQIKKALFVPAEFVRLEGEPTIRRDLARLQRSTPDPRYRAEFKQWRCRLPVEYDKEVLTREWVLRLFQRAGRFVGVGDWRVERKGIHGMFHVEEIVEEKK